MDFKKEIKLFDAVMLVAGTMIGSGIFIVSSDMARELGSSGWLIVAWLLSGVITVIGALSYGELSGMFPKAGGQYIYLKEAYGPFVSFLYGWTLFLVIQTGTIAAVGVAFAKFSGVLFEPLSENNILVTVGKFKLSAAQFLGVGVTILLTYLNTKGVKNGKYIQNIFGSTKIIALILLIIAGFFIGFNMDTWNLNWENPWDSKLYKLNEDGTLNGIYSISGSVLIVGIGVAMVGSLFSSDAWNNVTFAGDEVVNPTKTLPRALLIGTGLVTVIYILVNVVYLGIIPLVGNPDGNDAYELGMQFAKNDRVAISAAWLSGGSVLVYIMALLIMVSTFGCQNGCILSGARVYYSMAKDGLFFKPMAKLNSKGVPGVALWLQCIWACLLCLSGSYGNLLNYVMFAVVLFYILTIVGIFILRRTKPDLARPYKAPLYPILPLLYIFLAGAFVYILFENKQDYTLPGLIIIASGAPVYYLFSKKLKKSA
jgi:APA family basic amino acid/polyamine antiporter